MAPQVIAGATETGLHFIGDEQSACCTDQRCRLVDEAGRYPWQPFVGEQGVDQQRGGANALGLHRGNRRRDVGRVLLGQLRFGGAGRCVVQARNRHGPGMGGEGFRRGQGGGDFGQRCRVAVVVVVADDDAGAATGKARQAQRQFIGLAAGAGEHGGVQRRDEGRGQALGVAHHVFIQVAGVDVQRGGLAVHGLGHVRVAVTDAGHVVVDVEVAATVDVEQPDAFAAYQVQRFVVEQRRGAAEYAMTALQESVFRHGLEPR
ncbi:hypothetical protein D3C87_1318840 [compost metagenome]